MFTFYKVMKANKDKQTPYGKKRQENNQNKNSNNKLIYKNYEKKTKAKTGSHNN